MLSDSKLSSETSTASASLSKRTGARKEVIVKRANFVYLCLLFVGPLFGQSGSAPFGIHRSQYGSIGSIPLA